MDKPEGSLTVWISRDCLTRGIYALEVWDNKDGIVEERGRYSNAFRLGRDAHLSLEDAVIEARKERDLRIADLQGRITALSALFPEASNV